MTLPPPCLETSLLISYQESNTWQPPQPDTNAKTESPYQDADCIFLDNIVHELLALINGRPSSEKKAFDPLPRPVSATNDMLYAVEALDCLCILIFKCQMSWLTVFSDPKSLRVNEFDMPPAPFVFYPS